MACEKVQRVAKRRFVSVAAKYILKKFQRQIEDIPLYFASEGILKTNQDFCTFQSALMNEN